MLNEKYKECIEACKDCADACDTCSVACLQEDNVAAMANCIRLDIDCAAMCRLAVSAMVRDSEFSKAICQLCADICEACARECAQHDHDHCQQCATACETCANECRKMAA